MPPIYIPYEGERHTLAGVELTTPRYHLRTIQGLDEHPPQRGNDVDVANLPGARPFPREHGARLIAYGLAVTNRDANGDTPALEADADALYETNLRALQAALAEPHAQVALQRVRVSDARTLTATGWAMGLQELGEVLDRVEKSAIARVQLADPYWYGPDVVAGPTAIAASPTDLALAHPGTAPGHRLTLDFLGPITNPRVTDVETGFYVEVLAAVPAAQHLIIDCAAFTATLNGAQAIASLRHSGGFAWQRIRPGANTVRVTRTGGTGTLTATFRPPYI